MLTSLRFVQGAVAKNPIVPELTHVMIKNRRITSYNGSITLSCPINFEIDCYPKAETFVKALRACGDDVVAISMNANNKLTLKAGRLKVLIDCITDNFPEIEPEGEEVVLNGNIQPALKILEQFISEDASRPWSRGILFRGQSAYATNNVVLCEYWLGHTMPIDINVPREVVAELIRIGEEPQKLLVTDKHATFIFSDGKWLRAQLLSTEFPDLGKILNQPHNAETIPVGLFDAVEKIKPFVEKSGTVYFKNGAIATALTDDETGAHMEMDGLNHTAAYNVHMLLKLKDVADKIDFSTYPKPNIFMSDKYAVRGAIVGVRT